MGRPGSNPCAAFREVTRAICRRGEETKSPTYTTFTFGLSFPLFPIVGGHISVTQDRYQQWYIGFGADISPNLGVTLSLVSGFIKDEDLPRDPQKRPAFIRDVFMSGFSQQISFAPVIYSGISLPTNPNSPRVIAEEYGLAAPEAGWADTYTLPLGNPNEE
jgi:hypothetical protein